MGFVYTRSAYNTRRGALQDEHGSWWERESETARKRRWESFLTHVNTRLCSLVRASVKRRVRESNHEYSDGKGLRRCIGETESETGRQRGRKKVIMTRIRKQRRRTTVSEREKERRRMREGGKFRRKEYHCIISEPRNDYGRGARGFAEIGKARGKLYPAFPRLYPLSCNINSRHLSPCRHILTPCDVPASR